MNANDATFLNSVSAISLYEENNVWYKGGYQ